jgi:hypothetical protein
MISWQGQMGIGKETSYGTAVVPTRYLECQRGNAEITAARIVSEEARGTRWQYRDIKTGLDYSFNWEMWAHPENIGEILEAALGALSSVVLVSAEMRHTVIPASSLPSLSISVDRAVGASPTFRLAGAKIDTLTFENTARDVLRLTVDGAAQKHALVAALAPTDSDYADLSIHPFIFKNLGFTKGYNGVAPSADTTIERFMVSVVNNLVRDKVTAEGTDYIAALPEGILVVTGAFDREFEDVNDFNAFVADQQLDIVATWTGSSMGTNNYRLQLDIPNARITTLPLPEIAGTSDRGIYTIEFHALYYATDTRVLAAILDNKETY